MTGPQIMVLKLGPYVWVQVEWYTLSKRCDLAERRWYLTHYRCLSYEAPAPSSVYKPERACRKVSGRPACTYKVWRKRKTAIGVTWHHADKWTKESLDGFNRNYAFLLNAWGCLVEYKSTGHGLGRHTFWHMTFLSLGFLTWKMGIILSVLFPLSLIVKIKIW